MDKYVTQRTITLVMWPGREMLTASSHAPFSTVEIPNTVLQEKVVHRAREGGHDRFAELLSEIYEKVSLIFSRINKSYWFILFLSILTLVFHEKSNYAGSVLLLFYSSVAYRCSSR